ncbi:MAG: hypothetical protein CL666_07505 [Balneola sp.]|nr:hypothetical protein [Balneola sp.]|tara:strand:+ start:3099 stop:4031 length:933 start_codon:yes stop_codon:yes gene_type:complete
MIDRITRVHLRDIWKHEAYDFTTWLQENIDILKEVIGLEIINPEIEQSTGSFNVDITAEDASGNIIVIENQLEKSDHDHLGKIITYLTSFEAKVAIWIVAEPRQEHINAISWLNESTEADFYLIKIEGIKIGESDPAPLMTKIVGPSEEAKSIGKTKQAKSERHKLRFRFWDGLLEHSKSRHNLFNSISPSHYNWIGTSSGLRGVNYSYWIKKDSISLKIYIDRGKEADDENLAIFNELLTKKDQIEEIFGESLDWEELEGSRSCVIKKDYEVGGWQTPEEEWDTIYEKVVESMVRLEKATKPEIQKIRI